MKNVYVLRNRLISAYLDPFIKVEDQKQVSIDLQRYCILNKEEAIRNHFNESELYFIGTYNDETGVFDLLAEKEFICDLGQYFPKD